MQELNGFNVRVYAVCVQDGQLLTLVEPFAGNMVRKLPGGGLEFGEGPVDCLHREFLEELNLEIEVQDAFYIQEQFVNSLVKNQKQIVMLYFKVKILNLEQMQILDPNIKAAEWVPINDECKLTLPVDQMMYRKLLAQGF